MTVAIQESTLNADRRARLRTALAAAAFDAVIATSGANVNYASGYRSLAAGVHGTSPVAVLLTGDDLLMAGPVSDSAPAFDAGAVAEDAFFAYGRFFFASEGDAATPTRLVDQYPGQLQALVAAIRAAGLSAGTIALDESGVPVPFAAELRSALPDVRWQDASEWLGQVRAAKLEAEVDLLRRVAALAEDGVLAAVAQLSGETTERELAATIAATMAAGGAEPRFAGVTSGPRSALADA